jgi:hypothetical protein
MEQNSLTTNYSQVDYSLITRLMVFSTIKKKEDKIAHLMVLIGASNLTGKTKALPRD